MNIENWGGAQYVLSIYWVISLFVIVTVQILGVNFAWASQKSKYEPAVKILNRAVNIGVLAIVLYWGGFWK